MTPGVVRATYVLAAAAFACGGSNYVLSGLLPSLAAELHQSPAVVGQLGTAFGVTSGTVALIGGTLTAHLPRRRVLLAGLWISCSGNIFSALAPTFPMLLAARVITAAGCALGMVAAIGQAADLNPAAHRARAIAVAIGGLTLALACTPPLANLAAAHLGAPFVFAALAWLAALALAATLIALPAPRATRTGRDPLRSVLKVATAPGIASTLGAKLAAGTGSFMVQTYLTTLSGYGDAAVQLAAYGCGAVAGTQAGGWLTDLTKPRTVALVSICAQAAAFAACPVLSHVPGGLPAVAFVGAGAFWSAQPAFGRQVVDLARHRAPAALSLDSTTVYLAQAGGALLGAMQPAATRAVSLPATAAALSVIALATLVFSGRNSPPTRVSEGTKPRRPDRTNAWVDHAWDAAHPSRRR